MRVADSLWWLFFVRLVEERRGRVSKPGEVDDERRARRLRRGLIRRADAESGLRLQQHLDGATGIHGGVRLGGLLQRQGEVEHLARVDLLGPDHVD